METRSSLRRIQGEEGIALIIALMATMLLTALGMTLVLMSNTETMISANFRNSQEALYAADAATERVVQDLLLIPRWNDILAAGATSRDCGAGLTVNESATPSGFIDTTLTPTIAGSNLSLDLMKATCNLQSGTNGSAIWGTNNPTWRLFAWGKMKDLLPNNVIDSQMYLVVWVADDPADGDGDPLADTNGVLTVHAEAYGPSGARKTVEVTVAKTSSTEIERGQIAQRGQDELNQRARKAAVQTPGKSLTEMKLNTTATATTGLLGIQP
jgi:Tfp pilus assembly protein PilX